MLPVQDLCLPNTICVFSMLIDMFQYFYISDWASYGHLLFNLITIILISTLGMLASMVSNEVSRKNLNQSLVFDDLNEKINILSCLTI